MSLDLATLLAALAAVLAVAALVLVAVRGRRGRPETEEAATAEAQRLERIALVTERLAESQSQLAGRLEQSQSAVNERLDGLSKRLGDSLAEQTEKTGQTLKTLHERLAVIDHAQKNITDLSQQMVGLQDILSNKQARGAFGEIQLNDLVTAALPASAYSFQATLSNGRKADCLLNLPNPPGPIAIDSKFPLESYQQLRAAETDAERTQAARSFQQACVKHVKDIEERYIITGETAESALMFLPSEAVYAELHANFRNVVEESFRRRVWIVSPTTLMATLNTVRAILRDVHMREQADVIQNEVRKMLQDVGRLDDRVGKLETHFDQAHRDIRDIRISTDKITKRGVKIDELEVGDEEEAGGLLSAPKGGEAAE